ncbi:MAG: glucoamylase family protein, partial [Candidatus Neoclostridium sp.]
TLDEDNFTVCADKLCAAMTHPANKNASVAALRAKGSISSVGRNAYTRIFGGESSGNYDVISGDFERDVLGVGNYTGKGIYRVADFTAKTENAFTDNAILSHDYIEGAFCGAISTDFTVLESVPANYSKSEARRMRWLRGDVQLLPYLFPRIKNKKDEKTVNPLNFSQKMHIFSNIFSAILPVIELLALIVFCNNNNIVGLLLLSGVVFLPTICSLFSCGLSEKSTVKAFVVNLFELVTLPYRAVADSFAFWLTIVRLITRKNLMEWNTFAKAKGNYYYLVINILFSVLFVIWGVFSGGVLFYVFAAIFSLIFVLPLTELEKKEKSVPLEVEFLKNVGRDTWKYYETQFDSGNYLVSDNFSMLNGEKFAKRTSPTNIGLSLCSAVCALKLGFIDRKKFDLVTERIFDRIVALEKWHGHLYNWYDTDNGTVLYPSYVSTVDSGNFFMCVCYVKPFLSEKCAAIADDMIKSVDFSRLFDWKKSLFYIGYNCFDKRMDAAHYDLTASEALITYIFCLGYNKIPVCSAKALSAKFSKKYRCMYSWTGGCFEYTMPLLFVDYSKYSNLFLSVRAYEKLQEKSTVCGAWGISESQYRAADDSGNYMYKAFGLKEVALSPRVSGGVIAPYASLTCLAINDKSVLNNLKRLCELGLYGKFGFYEAFDGAPVMTFMAHHQGMILTAITNYIDGSAKQRLTREPRISSAMRIIESAPVFERYAYRKQAKRLEKIDAEERTFALFDNAYSSINLICGGNYYLTTGLNGNGKAVYKNAVIYDNICGSGGFDVTASVFDEQKRVTLVRFVKGKTEINQMSGGVSINCEIVPINGFDGERRNYYFENLGEKSVNVDIRAKIELILAKENDYSAHPAFNRLFVSVYDRKDGMVLCENRKNGNICGVSVGGITAKICISDAVLGAEGAITLAPGEKKSVSFCVFCADNKPELEKRAKILGDGRLFSAVTTNATFAEESGMTIDDCAFAAKIQFKKFGSNVELQKNGYDYSNPVRVISVKSYSDVIGLEKKLSKLTKLYKFGYKFDVVIQIGEADGYFSVLKKEVEAVIIATGIRKAALNTCKIDTVNEKDGE